MTVSGWNVLLMIATFQCAQNERVFWIRKQNWSIGPLGLFLLYLFVVVAAAPDWNGWNNLAYDHSNDFVVVFGCWRTKSSQSQKGFFNNRKLISPAAAAQAQAFSSQSHYWKYESFCQRRKQHELENVKRRPCRCQHKSLNKLGSPTKDQRTTAEEETDGHWLRNKDRAGGRGVVDKTTTAAAAAPVTMPKATFLVFFQKLQQPSATAPRFQQFLFHPGLAKVRPTSKSESRNSYALPNKTCQPCFFFKFLYHNLTRDQMTGKTATPKTKNLIHSLWERKSHKSFANKSG